MTDVNETFGEEGDVFDAESNGKVMHEKMMARERAYSVPAVGPTAPRDRGYSISVADTCLLYTSPSPRDGLLSRMPSSA